MAGRKSRRFKQLSLSMCFFKLRGGGEAYLLSNYFLRCQNSLELNSFVPMPLFLQVFKKNSFTHP